MLRFRARWREWALLLLGIVAPLALTLEYVRAFGRNVPIHDEWNHLGMVRDFYEGAPWVDDVVAYYGEHRVVVPKLMILALSTVSHLNVKLEMYLSALLMALAAWACWRLLLASEAAPRWVIVPIGWLLISTAQYENLLVGWQFQIPLMNALVAWGVVALAGAGAWRLAAAATALAVATFSFANGLLAWGAALPLVLVAGAARRRWLRLAIWAAVAGAVATLYVWGYAGFQRVPGGYFAAPLRHPFDATRLFLALYGNNLGLGRIDASMAAGAVLILLLALAVLVVWRWDRWRRTDVPWLALWLFSFVSIASIVVGRSFAWREFATPSRYLTLSVFVAVATLYAAARALAVLWRRDRRWRVTAVGAGLMLAGGLVVAEVRTARVGWAVGPANRDLKDAARPCLLQYRTAAEECLDDLFVADGEWVRAQAPILERWRLGPFAEVPAWATDPAAPATESTIGHVDYLGAHPLDSGQGQVRRGETVLVEGWAVSPSGTTPAEIVITIGDRPVAATFVFFLRPDVSVAYGRPIPPCGWRVFFDTNELQPGDHVVRALARDSASKQLFVIAGRSNLSIRDRDR